MRNGISWNLGILEGDWIGACYLVFCLSLQSDFYSYIRVSVDLLV